MSIGTRTKVGLLATIGVGALFAMGSSTPAFAGVPEGNYNIGSGSCLAIEKIQLQRASDGLLHDYMANDPTQDSATDPYWCRFTIVDNGVQIWPSSQYPYTGAQSPWFYDGPGHTMQACADRYYNGTRQTHNCGPLN